MCIGQIDFVGDVTVGASSKPARNVIGQLDFIGDVTVGAGSKPAKKIRGICLIGIGIYDLCKLIFNKFDLSMILAMIFIKCHPSAY